MAAKASSDLTDTVSPPKKNNLTDTVCPPPKNDLTDTKKKFREELLDLLKCQSDKFSAESSRYCDSVEKMATIVQKLLQGEKHLLEKVVAHADFLRLYWSPARRSLNPSVVVRLKEGDDLGFAGCCTRII